MQLRHAATTDTGRTREHNEDTFAFEVAPERPDSGALFVVCDGMGGFAAGEVASQLAAETILARFYAMTDRDRRAALEQAFLEANQRVWREGRGSMGTTGVAALFRGDGVLLANVGDSRAYLLRNGKLEQITQDHSFVAEQVSAGVMTNDQARNSSYRNIITRALGHRPQVEIDLFQRRLTPDDRVLLCSDGLYGAVEAEEIAEIAATLPPQEAVHRLVELANERGGPDNITAVLIEVVSIDGDRTETPNAQLGARGTGNRPGTERMAVPSEAALKTAQPAAGRRSATTARTVVVAPMPAAAPRRAPVLGLIMMTLAALALLGGLGYLFVSGALDPEGIPATPTIRQITPVGVGTVLPATPPARGPTLVPTAPATSPRGNATATPQRGAAP